MTDPVPALSRLARSPLLQRLLDYARLMRLHRPIGIVLLLWPTMWALWFAAGGPPRLQILMIFLVGTVLMRSAGCVINDYFDREFDRHVTRTRDRPLAAGRLQPREALWLFGVLCALAFAVALPLPWPALALAVPGLLLAVSYPLAKRWTYLPQAHLGLAFSWGIPMAFAAVSDHVPLLLTVLLMAANWAWVMAYDTLYAMADREDDLRIGVKSTAILFGEHDLRTVALLHAVALMLLAGAGLVDRRGPEYFIGLAIAGILAAYQQGIAGRRDSAGAFRAFIHNHWFGLAVFAGIEFSS
jgi:4-hydroxybenzoate polyprenyltransferase